MKYEEQMHIFFPAETNSSGDLGTSWQEASTQNNDAPAPLPGWEVGPEIAVEHRCLEDEPINVN